MNTLTSVRKLRAEQAKAAQEYQQQLQHIQKTADVDAERIRKRTDAEIADLRTTVRKLESDLEKVCHYPTSYFLASG